MGVADEGGWSRMDWRSWSDLAEVRARLAAGADPDAELGDRGSALHIAVELGSADVVAQLAGLVDDVDAEYDGRTALWIAVQADQPDHARALAAAGADPWRPMMAGWSPGRLSLASRTPGLFTAPPGAPGLAPAEAATVTEAHRLIDALGDFHHEGMSLAGVGGIDAAEAVRRLDAAVVQHDDPASMVEELWHDPMSEAALLTVGVTDVPGGCVVSQPWAFGAATPGGCRRLSTGTVCYAMYANPKSGDQGRIVRDGVVEGGDLHPGGGWSARDDPAEEILRTYLYRDKAVAYCCAYVGLRPTDARAFTGPPDLWVRMPPRDQAT
jgi:Ankyrin repeats (3 copies)